MVKMFEQDSYWLCVNPISGESIYSTGFTQEHIQVRLAEVKAPDKGSYRLMGIIYYFGPIVLRI